MAAARRSKAAQLLHDKLTTSTSLAQRACGRFDTVRSGRISVSELRTAINQTTSAADMVEVRFMLPSASWCSKPE